MFSGRPDKRMRHPAFAVIFSSLKTSWPRSLSACSVSLLVEAANFVPAGYRPSGRYTPPLPSR